MKYSRDDYGNCFFSPDSLLEVLRLGIFPISDLDAARAMVWSGAIGREDYVERMDRVMATYWEETKSHVESLAHSDPVKAYLLIHRFAAGNDVPPEALEMRKNLQPLALKAMEAQLQHCRAEGRHAAALFALYRCAFLSGLDEPPELAKDVSAREVARRIGRTLQLQGNQPIDRFRKATDRFLEQQFGGTAFISKIFPDICPVLRFEGKVLEYVVDRKERTVYLPHSYHKIELQPLDQRKLEVAIAEYEKLKAQYEAIMREAEPFEPAYKTYTAPNFESLQNAFPHASQSSFSKEAGGSWKRERRSANQSLRGSFRRGRRKHGLFQRPRVFVHPQG